MHCGETFGTNDPDCHQTAKHLGRRPLDCGMDRVQMIAVRSVQWHAATIDTVTDRFHAQIDLRVEWTESANGSFHGSFIEHYDISSRAGASGQLARLTLTGSAAASSLTTFGLRTGISS